MDLQKRSVQIMALNLVTVAFFVGVGVFGLWAAGIMSVIGTAAAASADEISYHGWTGSADLINRSFLGCHLDSPKPKDLPLADSKMLSSSPIRVVANSTTQFFIQYNSQAFLPELNLNPVPPPPEEQTPIPRVGTTYQVRIAAPPFHFSDLILAGKSTFLYPWSGSLYEARIVEAAPDFARVLIRLNEGNLDALQKAVEFGIEWPRWRSLMNSNLVETGNFELLDVQHPGSWLNIFQTNDTYGAIKEVIACASRHGR